MAAAGVQDRVRIIFCDYRDVADAWACNVALYLHYHPLSARSQYVSGSQKLVCTLCPKWSSLQAVFGLHSKGNMAGGMLGSTVRPVGILMSLAATDLDQAGFGDPQS